MDIDIYADLDFDLGKKFVELEKKNEDLSAEINKLEATVLVLNEEITKIKEINEVLKTNISELYKTALAELQRKNRVLAETRKELDDLIIRRAKADSPKESNEYKALLVEHKRKCAQIVDKDKEIATLKEKLEFEIRKGEDLKKNAECSSSGFKRGYLDGDANDRACKRSRYGHEKMNEFHDEYRDQRVRNAKEYHDYRRHPFDFRYRNNRRNYEHGRDYPRDRYYPDHFSNRNHHPNDNFDYAQRSQDYYDSRMQKEEAADLHSKRSDAKCEGNFDFQRKYLPDTNTYNSQKLSRLKECTNLNKLDGKDVAWRLSPIENKMQKPPEQIQNRKTFAEKSTTMSPITDWENFGSCVTETATKATSTTVELPPPSDLKFKNTEVHNSTEYSDPGAKQTGINKSDQVRKDATFTPFELPKPLDPNIGFEIAKELLELIETKELEKDTEKHAEPDLKRNEHKRKKAKKKKARIAYLSDEKWHPEAVKEKRNTAPKTNATLKSENEISTNVSNDPEFRHLKNVYNPVNEEPTRFEVEDNTNSKSEDEFLRNWKMGLALKKFKIPKKRRKPECRNDENEDECKMSENTSTTNLQMSKNCNVKSKIEMDRNDEIIQKRELKSYREFDNDSVMTVDIEESLLCALKPQEPEKLRNEESVRELNLRRQFDMVTKSNVGKINLESLHSNAEVKKPDRGKSRKIEKNSSILKWILAEKNKDSVTKRDIKRETELIAEESVTSKCLNELEFEEISDSSDKEVSVTKTKNENLYLEQDSKNETVSDISEQVNHRRSAETETKEKIKKSKPEAVITEDINKNVENPMGFQRKSNDSKPVPDTTDEGNFCGIRRFKNVTINVIDPAKRKTSSENLLSLKPDIEIFRIPGKMTNDTIESNKQITPTDIDENNMFEHKTNIWEPKDKLMRQPKLKFVRLKSKKRKDNYFVFDMTEFEGSVDHVNNKTQFAENYPYEDDNLSSLQKKRDEIIKTILATKTETEEDKLITEMDPKEAEINFEKEVEVTEPIKSAKPKINILKIEEIDECNKIDIKKILSEGKYSTDNNLLMQTKSPNPKKMERKKKSDAAKSDTSTKSNDKKYAKLKDVEFVSTTALSNKEQNENFPNVEIVKDTSVENVEDTDQKSQEKTKKVIVKEKNKKEVSRITHPVQDPDFITTDENVLKKDEDMIESHNNVLGTKSQIKESAEHVLSGTQKEVSENGLRINQEKTIDNIIDRKRKNTEYKPDTNEKIKHSFGISTFIPKVNAQDELNDPLHNVRINKEPKVETTSHLTDEKFIKVMENVTINKRKSTEPKKLVSIPAKLLTKKRPETGEDKITKSEDVEMNKRKSKESTKPTKTQPVEDAIEPLTNQEKIHENILKEENTTCGKNRNIQIVSDKPSEVHTKPLPIDQREVTETAFVPESYNVSLNTRSKLQLVEPAKEVQQTNVLPEKSDPHNSKQTHKRKISRSSSPYNKIIRIESPTKIASNSNVLPTENNPDLELNRCTRVTRSSVSPQKKQGLYTVKSDRVSCMLAAKQDAFAVPDKCTRTSSENLVLKETVQKEQHNNRDFPRKDITKTEEASNSNKEGSSNSSSDCSSDSSSCYSCSDSNCSCNDSDSDSSSHSESSKTSVAEKPIATNSTGPDTKSPVVATISPKCVTKSPVTPTKALIVAAHSSILVSKSSVSPTKLLNVTEELPLPAEVPFLVAEGDSFSLLPASSVSLSIENTPSLLTTKSPTISTPNLPIPATNSSTLPVAASTPLFTLNLAHILVENISKVPDSAPLSVAALKPLPTSPKKSSTVPTVKPLVTSIPVVETSAVVQPLPKTSTISTEKSLQVCAAKSSAMIPISTVDTSESKIDTTLQRNTATELENSVTKHETVAITLQTAVTTSQKTSTTSINATTSQRTETTSHKMTTSQKTATTSQITGTTSRTIAEKLQAAASTSNTTAAKSQPIAITSSKAATLSNIIATVSQSAVPTASTLQETTATSHTTAAKSQTGATTTLTTAITMLPTATTLTTAVTSQANATARTDVASENPATSRTSATTFRTPTTTSHTTATTSRTSATSSRITDEKSQADTTLTTVTQTRPAATTLTTGTTTLTTETTSLANARSRVTTSQTTTTTAHTTTTTSQTTTTSSRTTVTTPSIIAIMQKTATTSQIADTTSQTIAATSPTTGTTSSTTMRTLCAAAAKLQTAAAASRQTTTTSQTTATTSQISATTTAKTLQTTATTSLKTGITSNTTTAKSHTTSKTSPAVATSQRTSTVLQTSAVISQSPAATSPNTATTSQKTVTTSQETAATSEKTAAISHKSAATSHKSAATSHKSAATSHKSAATSQKITETSQKSAAASQKITDTSQKTATTSQKIAATSQKTSTTSQKTSATSQKTAAISQKTTGTSQKTAAISQKTGSTSQKTAALSQKTAGTSQKTAATSQKTVATSQKTADTSQKTAATSQKSAKTSQKPTTTSQKIETTSQKTADTSQKIAATSQKTATTVEKTAATSQKTAAASHKTYSRSQKTEKTSQKTVASSLKTAPISQTTVGTPQETSKSHKNVAASSKTATTSLKGAITCKKTSTSPKTAAISPKIETTPKTAVTSQKTSTSQITTKTSSKTSLTSKKTATSQATVSTSKTTKTTPQTSSTTSDMVATTSEAVVPTSQATTATPETTSITSKTAAVRSQTTRVTRKTASLTSKTTTTAVGTISEATVRTSQPTPTTSQVTATSVQITATAHSNATTVTTAETTATTSQASATTLHDTATNSESAPLKQRRRRCVITIM